MRLTSMLAALCVLGATASCTTTFTTERNPFLTFTEGFTASSDDDTGSNGSGSRRPVIGGFRREMALLFANNHPDYELNFTFAAWVNVGSIRSADQQDVLLSNGYVQLLEETRIGTAFTLPPGTFVFNGTGVAGATTVRLGPTARSTPLPTTTTFELLTPDAILVFTQPPTACDSVAFYYTQDGQLVYSPPLSGGLGFTEGATGAGGQKTLAQIDGYQCDPFMPGFFLKLGGGGRRGNEYFEGEDLGIVFNPTPNASGDFAEVTIGENLTLVDETP
ncbi:MAG: hypothetical protein CHACPFDD_00530 [Phycisphaerae bacterium]|nr:hypothetical protein [Phycisphaerae bacterium]